MNKPDNVLECVFAYETEAGEKGIVRADSYEDAIDRVNDSQYTFKDSPCYGVKSIVKLYELDDLSYGVIPEERIKANLKETTKVRCTMTAKDKWEAIEEALDNMSLRYDISEEKDALIEFWTDTAGQDVLTEFYYDGTPEDYVRQFTKCAENYDVDEEVELLVGKRGRNGVPNTVRELLDDCQEAKDTLMKIAEELQKTMR